MLTVGDIARANPAVRGVLCVNCNMGIGNLKESTTIMEAAIAYVKKWR